MNLIYSGQHKEIQGKSIFLAGCSPRKGQTLVWRKEIVELFRQNNFEGTLIIPEPEHNHWADYVDVIDWECEYLKLVDVILFWIPRSIDNQIFGFTSNVEFGRWVYSDKPIIYGRPDNSDNNRYLDYIYTKETGRNPLNNLEDLVKETLKNI